jgi:CRISPR-associated endonuclease/helicase Cas3
MKAVHAGLIGSDCLILLDEAHLAKPFQQTLEWIQVYKGKGWREAESSAPWGVALLTATPGEQAEGAFSLDDEDRSHPVLQKRLDASKPARLIAPAKPKAKQEEDSETTGEDEVRIRRGKDLVCRAEAVLKEVRHAIVSFPGSVGGDMTAARIIVERFGSFPGLA